MSDPMRNDVSAIRKKIDAVSKELKPLGHICQKKVMARGRVHLIKDLISVYLLFLKLIVCITCLSGERVQGSARGFQ